MDKLETISFEDLSSKAYDYLVEQQEICRSVYKIESYQSWFYDQLTGELTFSDAEVKKLIINFESVGSFSLKSNTWMWSWANKHTQEKVKSEIIKVKEFGEKRNFEKLFDPIWEAEEVDGWEMAGISAYILQAKGVYRAPS